MRLSYSSVAVLAFSLATVPALAAEGSAPSAEKAAVSAENRAPASESASARRAPGTSQDIARYSERQAASPEAKKYEGGDTVVIGATTATIVLAVVLLIVLL